MRKSIAEIAGYSDDNPEVLAARDDFAEYLRYTDCLVAHRKKLDITQREVADRMGTVQSAVSELERSDSDPRVSTLMRYARALGVPFKFRLPVIDGGTLAALRPVPQFIEVPPVDGYQTIATVAL